MASNLKMEAGWPVSPWTVTEVHIGFSPFSFHILMFQSAFLLKMNFPSKMDLCTPFQETFSFLPVGIPLFVLIPALLIVASLYAD